MNVLKSFVNGIVCLLWFGLPFVIICSAILRSPPNAELKGVVLALQFSRILLVAITMAAIIFYLTLYMIGFVAGSPDLEYLLLALVMAPVGFGLLYCIFVLLINVIMNTYLLQYVAEKRHASEPEMTVVLRWCRRLRWLHEVLFWARGTKLERVLDAVISWPGVLDER